MKPRKTATASVVPIATYLSALNAVSANCGAMLASKQTPGNIRRAISTVGRLTAAQAAYWTKNTAAYGQIGSAVAAKPAASAKSKAQRAGA